jgi:hypothetical protein
MSRTIFHIAALIAVAFASSAHAQSSAATPPAPPAISLGVDSGSVLVSTGGEFTQASSGQVIAPGHRILVPEGGSASLTYGNGCGKALTSAGVYTVSGDCQLASNASSSSGLSTGTVVGIVGGAAVIAAVAGGGGSDSGPVSR